MVSNNIGLAGEFYAMHKLFLQGCEATLTLGNTKGIDILVYNPKNEKQFKVEVKTSTTKGNLKIFRQEFGEHYMQWMMREKHESYWEKKNLVYCFVFIDKNKKEEPKIFFFPPQDVGMRIRWAHKTWLHSKHKKQVKDGDMRHFFISFNNLDKNVFKNNFKIFE